MARFTSELRRLLLIRGLARAIAPIAVLWGIFDWWIIHALCGLIFAALTFNYVLIYVLSWVAPSAMNGPWRIRSWQTFVLIINAVALPIVFRNNFGRLPWGFIAVTLLFFIGLYAATAIYFYFNERLPMAEIFAQRRNETLPTTRSTIVQHADPTA